ncbi:cell division protein FtsQ/DivIB [Myroides sp. LJL116]
MRKSLKFIKWLDVRLFLIVVLAFVLYSFANHKNRNRDIQGIEINFKGNQSHFVTSQQVKKGIEEQLAWQAGVNKEQVQLKLLEESVLENLLIKDADVYLTLDGKLQVDVWQKDAIARLVEQGNSYYLDQVGNQMPLSSNFSKRVPMVSGEITEDIRPKLKEMLDIIAKDEFLNNDITGILLLPDDSIQLMSRSNSFEIHFGDFEEMQRKLDNYKAFVQYSLQDGVSLEKYKKINLKFTQQVVCAK